MWNEIVNQKQTILSDLIEHINLIFAHLQHGIPRIFDSDNGSQFNSICKILMFHLSEKQSIASIRK